MIKRFGFLLAHWWLFTGCSVDSARNHYVLAEKLWTDRKYAAAVTEFDKVFSKDPHGKLGLQAAYRAAMTQYLFLSQYNDAIRKFKTFIQDSTDTRLTWDAQLQVGEILFSKLEQYDLAIQHYQMLLKTNPLAAEAPEFLFKIGKSQFFLFQFTDAVKTYEELEKKYPQSHWAEKANYEIGATYYTRGEQQREKSRLDKSPYQVAIDSYQKFIRHYPNSEWAPHARFGIASCLEELDQLDEAYKAFEALKESYPSRHLIEVKIKRIRQRLAHRHIHIK